MIHSVEPGCTTISFPAFLRIIEKQKERASRVDDQADRERNNITDATF